MKRRVAERVLLGMSAVATMVATGVGCSDSTGPGGAGGTTATTTTDSSGGTGPSECQPGTKRCSEDVPQACDATGSWTNQTACPYVCVDGECTGACMPGTKKCIGKTPQMCNDAGSWVDESPCALNCSEGVCTGSCSPGEKRCAGQSAQTCDAGGTWKTIETCTYVCSAGACSGTCQPGSGQCDGLAPQVCDATGQWQSSAACSGATPFCAAGVCSTTSPGCQGVSPGADSSCGPSSNESCCASQAVTGGAFFRSYDGATYPDQSFPATVTTFNLDKFEVTAGRFRQFVNAWIAGWRPLVGNGKHNHLNSGGGLAESDIGGGFESGWDPAWSAGIATTGTAWDSNLHAGGFRAAWTTLAATNENLPINYITWYEAYAFCVWDGGFLPSEAEWNYAASGGEQQRPYPWGATAPGTNASLAVYGCYLNGGGTCSPATANIGPVGSIAAGGGRYGQLDLAGNVFEWVLDSTAGYGPSCNDCAHGGGAELHGARGGGFDSSASGLLTGLRYGRTPGSRDYNLGVRCGRSP